MFRRLNGLYAAVIAIVALTSNTAWADHSRLLVDALKEAPTPFLLNGRPVPTEPIRLYYKNRDYAPAWTTGNPGSLNARGRAVVDCLKGSVRDGLDPAAYAIPDPAGQTATAIEIALSAALLRYAIDVGAGRVEPATLDPEHFAIGSNTDWESVLRNAGTISNVADFLETLAPATAEYRALRRALAAYRVIEADGGWSSVLAFPKNEKNSAGPALAALSKRLRATGDIDASAPWPDVDQGTLTPGIVRFQQRHGLTADGVVGLKTLAALNMPVAKRIRQIEINMERWRWMAVDLGDTHVFVNLAGFDLRAVRQGKTVQTMPVIVGQPYRKTPVFSDRISYLEVNPTWTVPYSIATKDILPKLRSDPSYLAKNGFQILQAGDEGGPVNPTTIDWSRYDRRHFPFRLRQLPGSTNALGRIKFMFPNKFAVYLHDTPARELFRKDVRMFSSGCIRVANPIALAEFLLEGDPAWTPDRLHRDVETGKTKVIRLRKPVPVHLSYLTAWVAEDETVHFRNDIYGRDAPLATALYRRSRR